MSSFASVGPFMLSVLTVRVAISSVEFAVSFLYPPHVSQSVGGLGQLISGWSAIAVTKAFKTIIGPQ